jgi:hypothetical protein
VPTATVNGVRLHYELHGDSGEPLVLVHGYTGDITWTVVVGEAGDRHRETYGAVLEAQVKAIEALAPGDCCLQTDSGKICSEFLMRLKLIEKSLPPIEEGLGIAKEDLLQQLDAAKNEPKFLPVIIKPAASQADLAFVESHRADLHATAIPTASRNVPTQTRSGLAAQC